MISGRGRIFHMGEEKVTLLAAAAAAADDSKGKDAHFFEGEIM